MDSPADYPKPAEVRDYEAENGIKRGVLTQKLTLAVMLALLGVVGYFGDRFVMQVEISLH